MHAPSAMNVCIEEREGGRERERVRDLSVHTIHSHSGKAYRFRGMDSMSGYHTYQTFRVWHLVSSPDLMLTQILPGPYKITSTVNALQMTRYNKRV